MLRRAGFVCLFSLFGAAMALTSSGASAWPMVEVRAETRIELRIVRRPDVIAVQGTLRDDRGDPLPGRMVEVRVADPQGITRRRETARTDRDGNVVLTLSRQLGSGRIIARFPGEPSYRGVEVARELDQGRAHVRLTMARADGSRLDRLDLDAREHRILVRAESPEGGAGLRVELEDELERPLASGTTASDGSVLLRVSSKSLGPPAAGRLVVRTPGDERRTGAQTEALVVRYLATRLELTVRPLQIPATEPLRVWGQLSDSAGPLARKAVGLFAGDEHLATVLTDDQGRYAREVRPEGGDGPVVLQARFSSDAPWRLSARSEPVQVEPGPRGATPWEWLIVPMVLCGFAAWWVSRRTRDKKEGDERTGRTPDSVRGVLPARTSARTAERDDVAGRIVDAMEGRPLIGATVTLRRGDSLLQTATDIGGAFRFESVPPGEWLMKMGQAGFEDCEARVSIPHRGQWSDVRVRLQSLRDLALARYQPVADVLAPASTWWGFWTPRELLERAGGEQRTELSSLTEAVERAAYGAEIPDAEDVRAIGQRAEQIAQLITSRRESVDRS